ARIRNVDITYYFMRDNLIENIFNLVYENTMIILANNLTSTTNINKFKDFISRVNVVNLD
ncbi:hypothetical protein COCMIDRAFT_46428, partial [Bipolaris oryzae ATCC 44560]